MEPDVFATHSYSFDPRHGYSFETLQTVQAPPAPEGFEDFWSKRYQQALEVAPRPRLADTGRNEKSWQIWDLAYTSTRQTEIRGWILLPEGRPIRRGFVVGHGYNGREAPDFHLPFEDAVLLFPCARGLGLSRHRKVSGDSQWHVLHNIHDRDRYVIGGCVEDLWTAVSVLLRLFPEVAGHVGYLGISFGGGVGALALPWEKRVSRAHFNVPTFGHHPLRIELPSVGSAASVQRFHRKNPQVLQTLAFYDAATAARYIHIPVHCACALFDPSVAPAGQFAIYNALGGERQLFVLSAGHFAYPAQAEEDRHLCQELNHFFAPL